MKQHARIRWTALALIAAVGLGFAAGNVTAKKDDGGHDPLYLTPVEEVIGLDYTVEVSGDDVHAVLSEQGRETDRLRIVGGTSLVRRGILSDGDTVFVSGRAAANGDKRHKHRGHVTILK